MRVLRWSAFLLAIGGLLLLYRAALQRELPFVTAAELTPSMQFAPVRARGMLAQPARVHRRDGEVTVVSFALRENGGELQAVAFGRTAQALAGDGSLSQPGRPLRITGVIRFSPRYGPQIHIRLPEHVERLEPVAGESLE